MTDTQTQEENTLPQETEEKAPETPAEKPEEKQEDNSQKKSGNDNVVFVGSKHLMNYVNSISMQFETNPKVIVKARGKFISKAADISEVAKRQMPNVKTNDITISTEEYENEGRKVKVSTIEITLGK